MHRVSHHQMGTTLSNRSPVRPTLSCNFRTGIIDAAWLTNVVDVCCLFNCLFDCLQMQHKQRCCLFACLEESFQKAYRKQVYRVVRFPSATRIQAGDRLGTLASVREPFQPSSHHLRLVIMTFITPTLVHSCHITPSPHQRLSQHVQGVSSGMTHPSCFTGGVGEYLEQVIQDIVPWASRQYNLSRDPEYVAFGGSSFGGICALSAAMKYSHVFGR